MAQRFAAWRYLVDLVSAVSMNAVDHRWFITSGLMVYFGWLSVPRPLQHRWLMSIG